MFQDNDAAAWRVIFSCALLLLLGFIGAVWYLVLLRRKIKQRMSEVKKGRKL